MDSNKPATQIYVENTIGVMKEFGEISEAVQALKKKYSLVRYYFPPHVREEIETIAGTKFKKGKAND